MKVQFWVFSGLLLSFVPLGAATGQELVGGYDAAVSRYESNVEVLLEDCRVLISFKEQRSKLNNITSRTDVSTGSSKVCITSPNLNVSALHTLANVLVGYGTGSIPAVGPVIDEIAGFILDKGFDVSRTKCYPINEGQTIFNELTEKLAELEDPYQELRAKVTERWWSVARAEDDVERLAHSGPPEMIQERIAHVRQLSSKKHVECPMF